VQIHSATFVSSHTDHQDAPATGLPEFAFIGRSNVGKSSLINLLTERKELARTSNTPGKTQLINYFAINEQWYLVDLPGYGYAQVSKKSRGKWSKMTEAYLQQRPTLVNAFVLIDSNIPPQAIDLEFCNWLGEHGIPFVLVYTKTDRKKKDIEEHIAAFEAAMLEHWETLPPSFVSSAVKGTGRAEILSFIEQTLVSIDLPTE
jgi:GTP-binding protein